MTRSEQRSGPSRNEVQAHRGASAVAPENTIAAFRAAAEQGAEWIELDVALLGDGTAVVIHDVSVDRCSSSKGNLGDLSAADLDKIDAGAWFDPRFNGEPLPTLAAVVSALGELGLNANVEIKQHPHHKSLDQLVKTVDEHLRARAPQTEIMISSFDAAALKRMHEINPSYELAMLWSKVPDDWREVLQSIPATTVHLGYKSLSIGFLEEAVRHGTKVRAWTSNDPRELASFWHAGLTGVITDDPSVYLS
ncbi:MULTISPECIES: glycerophosphoryl diester phosphodiesterase [Rhizobium]|uniref:Glycerophosphoryl diester phosphodiesterase n=1 Tax=Rhizobium phaseoli TaxID=396 RepID=A0A192THY3_9HYPH|nr:MULTISPECIES: glycerophosphoryl diester phosphodiesterase [Rhizobium]ANL42851.1 glycerophosphoryl diester phosphodiesterase protein [Rhizobium phaseoli]ANL55531.1 glycerophosphoryl diester phosphodiesterase protein [Rhizobium phaseoli]ANL61837.1 glycerophosphoryl diester phosphodiesterase protein [Rhizobium phaseoli]ANL87252.1 glycerophosphoryl diester phosphodiesterase protein [Rhizobium phaseoli]ANL93761.1 glycerophosphoryl diester phosphodiesterase protein [Rhizobium phaseoli]